MSPLQVIEWQAPEYEFHPKTPNWYWSIFIIAAVLALLALFTQNFLIVILILVATFSIMLYGGRRPALIKFAITHRGVRFHDRLYPYDYLKSFWVLESGRGRKLIVESGRVVLPHIILPLAPQLNAEHLREYLKQHLPEVRQEESLGDILSDYFGF